jgi:hypothetical protein
MARTVHEITRLTPATLVLRHRRKPKQSFFLNLDCRKLAFLTVISDAGESSRSVLIAAGGRHRSGDGHPVGKRGRMIAAESPHGDSV